MASEDGVTKTEASVPQRVSTDLWRELQRLAKEGGPHVDADSDPRDVMESALEFSLQLWEDMQIARDITPEPMICPLCLRPTAILPIFTSVAPIWLETGHACDCPVHKYREELALARRERWRAEHGPGGISLTFLQSMLGGGNDRKAVDDWLRIATQYEAQLPPRMRFTVTRDLPADLRPKNPIDEGELTLEARRGYERTRHTLQALVAGKKPTELETRPGQYLDETAARDSLFLIRNLPAPDEATALQVKAVFHEVSTGILEWACQRKDAHYTLIEYAHIGLGRRVAQFTEQEHSRLRQMDWTRTMLLMRNARPAEANPSDSSSPPEIS